jgi:hypothetical protein
VDRVSALRFCVELSDGTLGGLGGVGRTDDFPESGDGVGPLEGEWNDGPGGHELDQLRIEGALAVDRVEGPRLLRGQAGQPEGEYSESLLLQVGDDPAGMAGGNGVWLDDRKSA